MQETTPAFFLLQFFLRFDTTPPGVGVFVARGFNPGVAVFVPRGS